MKPLIISFFLVILGYSLLTDGREEVKEKVKEPKKLYQQENAVYNNAAPKQSNDSVFFSNTRSLEEKKGV
ncbi:MAG: hypothetical protein LBQ78_07835 [Tannerellaceae bacterium]|jgi:hypothetical protein|nr:hypothetical protein [Tannerellaceae bacterium]